MRLLLLLTLICFHLSSSAQNLSYTEKLYYTCKVWGFLKYYHSEVSECRVNWDSVLRDRLPAIKSTRDNNEFNDELYKMIIAAGPMTKLPTPLPDTLLPELKRNRNFGWFNDRFIRSDVRAMVNAVKKNFLPHEICWVQSGGGVVLNFPFDDPILDINTTEKYPGEAERLVLLCKYWNVINYFNPYNYVLDQRWDSTLMLSIPEIISASNPYELFLVIKRMSKFLDDAHVEGSTFSVYYSPLESLLRYFPPITVKFIDKDYVVVKSLDKAVSPGDIVLKINGMDMSRWETELSKLISAGNIRVLRRSVPLYLMAGAQFTVVDFEIQHFQGEIETLSFKRLYTLENIAHSFNFHLSDTSWTTLECNVGYVNMAKLAVKDVYKMYRDLKSKPVIIFDLRKYPQGTIWHIARLMFPNNTSIAQLQRPDAKYPGTFYWSSASFGIDNNPEAYKGKIILLINSETQSQGEYSCMVLEGMPKVTKIGSQTAGADGNVKTFRITQDIQSGFTSIGVFYPDFDSTQRVGIVPDSVIYVTAEGVRQKRDEVLEKAIETACDWIHKNGNIN